MLPYQSLEEAEEALGGALSVAEKLWFQYSAQKPDFILHCHNILFVMLFYTLAPLPFVFIGLGWFKNMDKFKIQPKVNDCFSNMFKCYKHVMRTFVLVVGPLQVISYPTIQWIGIRTSLPLPSSSEVFWQIVVYFIIEDFSHYWIHRMLHAKWAYKKIHRVHHEYTAPIGLAAPYAHWAEILILGLPSFLGPVLVPGHIITYWLWFILRQLEAIETHSGYLLPWSPTKYIPFYGGAEYHDYHHFVGEQSKSNFASIFTYCDYIYGTNKGYRSHKQVLEKVRSGAPTCLAWARYAPTKFLYGAGRDGAAHSFTFLSILDVAKTNTFSSPIGIVLGAHAMHVMSPSWALSAVSKSFPVSTHSHCSVVP